MSFQAMAWVIEEKLPTNEKFVLLMLANYASNDKWDCYPSIASLVDNTGMSRSTVLRVLKSLEDKGYLNIIKRMVDGINLPNIYQLVKPENKGEGGSITQTLPVSHRHEGSITQTLGVVSQGHPNLSYKPIIEPIKKINKKSSTVNVQEMIASVEGLSPEVASDYIEHRKFKKAKLTPRAWEGISKTINEFIKLGGNADQALIKAIERNWTGLELDWLLNIFRQKSSCQAVTDDWARGIEDSL